MRTKRALKLNAPKFVVGYTGELSEDEGWTRGVSDADEI